MKKLTNVVTLLLAVLFFMSTQLIAGEHPKAENPKAKKAEHPKAEKAEHPKAEVAKCTTPGCVDGSCDVCQAKKAKEEVSKAAACKAPACNVSKTKKTEHPK